MKYNIRCDMEGLTGITRMDQVQTEGKNYLQGRDALLHDLRAVIDGIKEVEPAAEIIIYDIHKEGANLDLLDLPRNVSYVAGKPAYTEECSGFIEGCAGMFLVGFHGKAGSVAALMPHSYEWDILDLQVNGVSLGEVGVEVAIAGEKGVPSLFYSGDSVGAAEFKGMIPDGIAVSVKESLSDFAAVCLSGPSVAEQLRSGAAEAVKRSRNIAPYKDPRMKGPVELKIRLKDNAYRKALKDLHPEVFIDDESVVIKKDTVTAGFAFYWKIKNQAKSRI